MAVANAMDQVFMVLGIELLQICTLGCEKMVPRRAAAVLCNEGRRRAQVVSCGHDCGRTPMRSAS